MKTEAEWAEWDEGEDDYDDDWYNDSCVRIPCPECAAPAFVSGDEIRRTCDCAWTDEQVAAALAPEEP